MLCDRHCFELACTAYAYGQRYMLRGFLPMKGPVFKSLRRPGGGHHLATPVSPPLCSMKGYVPIEENGEMYFNLFLSKVTTKALRSLIYVFSIC